MFRSSLNQDSILFGSNRTIARLSVSLAIGLAATLVAAANYSHHPTGALTDFDQIYVAARTLMAHGDPYRAVRAQGFPFPLYYPATAGVVTLPFLLLPLEWARAAFIGVGTGLCAWALSRKHWYPLLALLSGSYFSALLIDQWSPLLIGSAFLPGWLAGMVLSAKPTVGLALVIAFWIVPVRRMAVLASGALVLALVAVLLSPEWIRSWLEAIQYAPHIVPLVTLLPFGPLLLGALLRWRRPEGRLLLALACIPQTPSMYGTLLLFLLPSTRGETLALVILSDVAYYAMPDLTSTGPEALARYVHSSSWILSLLLYLPCLVMLLRRKNEGAFPDWLRSIMSRIRPMPSPEPPTVR